MLQPFFLSWQRAVEQNERSPLAHIYAGFFAGLAIPVSYGIYLAFQAMAHRASLPKIPNTAACGMEMMWPFVAIFFVGPVFGAIGAALGAALWYEDQASSDPTQELR